MAIRDSDTTRSQTNEKQIAFKEIKKISSKTLFADAQLVEIQHGGDVYQLRLTKTGKLILTK